MLSKIYNLLNYCYEDSMLEQLPNIEFQLFILSVKSLVPYENKIGCAFDLVRYKREVDTFKYYKNGHDETIEYYIKTQVSSNINDSLLEYKILPLIASNTVYEFVLEETLKLISFYTTNPKSILDAIILSSCIYDYLTTEEIIEMDMDLLNTNLKERLISFSIKDFIKSIDLNNIMDKSHFIDFEKERIKLLTKPSFFTEEIILKYKSLQHILNKSSVTKIPNKENSEVLNNFASYLLKLRKGTVNPEKLKLNITNIPDLKEFLKSSSFIHPLLGKCITLKRSNTEIILKNKLGLLKVKI